jgi:hypothetical protein
MATFTAIAEQWIAANLPMKLNAQGGKGEPASEAMNREQYSLAVVDPDAWADDIAGWALERCINRDDHEDYGGLSALLIDCAEWCIAHETVPPDRDVFFDILSRTGFLIVDGFVSGLILKIDLEAALAGDESEPAPGEVSSSDVSRPQDVRKQ